MVMDLHDFHWGSRTSVPPDPAIHIFCEGERDRRLYGRLLGPTLGRWISFVGPPFDEVANCHVQGGSEWALAMAKDRRRNSPLGGRLGPDLYNAYCLLDGEERLRAGARNVFVEASDLIVHRSARDHGLRDPNQHLVFGKEDLDSILFLNCNELENLYFLYADAWEWMEVSWEEYRTLFGHRKYIDDTWEILANAATIAALENPFKRYFGGASMGRKSIFSAFKRRDVQAAPLIEEAIDLLHRLLEPETARREIAEIRRLVALLGEGRRQVVDRSEWLFRMCNGKALFNATFNDTEVWRERLSTELVENGFAAEFQLSVAHALLGQGELSSSRLSQNYLPQIRFGRGRMRLSATARRGIVRRQHRRRFIPGGWAYWIP